MEQIEIELSAGQLELIGEKLATGNYADLSDYVAQVIKLHTRQLAQEKLEGLLLEGLNSGPGRPLEDVMRDLRAKHKLPV